ncbi:MAG TPA: glycosyltransferase [Thermodesulfovibrionales bacterium]|nr:glycosyltransferase [Thermodesulfovibrionales bacterium]
MNILFITPFLPYPPISGGRLQTFVRLKHLKNKGHCVFLLSLATPNEHSFVSELKNIIDDVCCIYMKRDLAKIRYLFRKSLLYEIFTYDRAFAGNTQKFLEDKKIDIAVFEHLGVAHYRDCIRLIPSVLSEQNVEREIVEQLVSYLSKSPSKIWQGKWDRKLRDMYLFLFGGYEQKLVGALESKALCEFNLCLTCSEKDARSLRKHSNGAPCVTIPWCVETPSLQHKPKVKDMYDLVFIGSMDWEPNRDAMKWFVKEIFPLVRRELKDMRLLIAGSSMSDDIRELDNGKDILVKGFVPDISTFLLHGDIFIAPIRMGGGVKVKVLEAMSYGIPVISTSKGAEGLHARNREHFLIADSPEEFVESISTLTNDQDLRLLMGMRGREYISRYHGVDSVIELIERCMIDVVKGNDAKVIIK